MNRKIPADAFEFYFGLGPERSYRAVAERFRVTKQAVVKAATRERWQERLQHIESQARAKSAEAAVESLSEMNDRHVKVLRAIQGRALETLRSMPLASAMDAVRALDLTIRQERLIRGEASERAELSVEDITRREIHELLVVDGDEAPPG